MRFVLVASIFAAGCVAGPIAQAGSESPPPVGTLNYIDSAPPELEPLKAKSLSLVSRETLPEQICPAGETYAFSECLDSQNLRSFCSVPLDRGGEVVYRHDSRCNSNEVCVQSELSSRSTYAQCLPIT